MSLMLRMLLRSLYPIEKLSLKLGKRLTFITSPG